LHEAVSDHIQSDKCSRACAYAEGTAVADSGRVPWSATAGNWHRA